MRFSDIVMLSQQIKRFTSGVNKLSYSILQVQKFYLLGVHPLFDGNSIFQVDIILLSGLFHYIVKLIFSRALQTLLHHAVSIFQTANYVH